MAQTENGVGVSFKLADNTMVWVRRDTWAEVIEDVTLIRGEIYAKSFENALSGQQADVAAATLDGPVVNDSTGQQITPAQAAAILGADPAQVSGQAFATCPKCGGPKNKLIPAGFSTKTQKPYKAFYVCPVQGH